MRETMIASRIESLARVELNPVETVEKNRTTPDPEGMRESCVGFV